MKGFDTWPDIPVQYVLVNFDAIWPSIPPGVYERYPSLERELDEHRRMYSEIGNSRR